MLKFSTEIGGEIPLKPGTNLGYRLPKVKGYSIKYGDTVKVMTERVCSVILNRLSMR